MATLMQLTDMLSKYHQANDLLYRGIQLMYVILANCADKQCVTVHKYLLSMLQIK